MNRIAATLVLALFALPASAEGDKMFMVKRIWVPNVQEINTPELDKAHQEHIADRSVSVVSAQLLDKNDKPIGVISIKGFNDWDEVNSYVYDDPYTKAGLYSEITIDAINMYVLNAMFARAPDWYKERFPERAAAYTPPAAE